MDHYEHHARRPLLSFLSDNEIDAIHDTSLEILEGVGVDIHHEEARKLLYEAGAFVDGVNVRLPSNLVKYALGHAPERVVLADRNGNRVMPLEGTRPFFGTGSDLLHAIDIHTGRRRLSNLEDVGSSAKLSDALPNIDFIMSYAMPHDVSEDRIGLCQTAEILKNSVKPLVMTAFNSDAMLRKTIDICAIAAGGLEELQKNPFLCIYGQFVSPLVHSAEALDRLFTCAQYRIPVIYIPTIMAGMSGPATMAGAIAIGNAEVLAGLVISQLKRKGAPFIYGGCISSFDMSKIILPYGAPEWHMASAVMCQLARRYGLPIFSTAGCSDSKLPDEQAAAEGAFSLLMAGLSGANLIHDVGYLESGLTGSLAYLTMCDEMISYVKRILQNMEVSAGTLALELVRRVGPGGFFAGEKHTAANFKKETWYPDLFDRNIYDNWEKQGATTFAQRAAAKALHLLESHRPEPLDEFILKEMEKAIHAL